MSINVPRIISMFAVAIATMLPATSAAMTKLYTEYLVSTDGKNTVLYTGATSRGSSEGITFTKERAWLNAQGDVNRYVNYYVTGKDDKKYYLLAGAMREGDTGYDNFVQLPFPETYKRVVNGDNATHYAYNYGDYKEFLDWVKIQFREWTLLNSSTNEFLAQFRISATNEWDRYDTMHFLDPEISYVQIDVAAPAKQMCRIDYECKLSYSSGGGTGEMASQVVTNSGVVAENSFTREGYTFDGWQIGSTKYSSGQQLSDLKNDMDFTATWKPNTYTVTFNANGGSVSQSTKSVTYASTYGQLPDPTRDGYKFNGWYTSATSGSLVDSSTTVTITTDQTLYAHWIANTYYVTFNANGGTGTMSNETFTYGVAKALTANAFTRTGYTFAGWAISASGAKVYNDKQSVSNFTATSGGTVTLYAKWTANTYTVVFNANGGTGTMSNETFSYDAAKALTANAFTRTGYTFAGWAISASGAKVYNDKQSVSNLTATSGGTVNLYAKWTANTYTVVFDANGGTGTMSNDAFTYGTAKALTANAFTRTGYTFAGWNTKSDGTGTSYSNSQSVSNLTAENNGMIILYAKWTANKYTVTLDKQSGTGGTASVTATYGSAMPTATMPTRTGYTFGGYYDATSGGTKYYNADGSSAWTWNKTAETTLYARWTAKKSALTFDANGGSGEMTTGLSATYGSAMPTPVNLPTRTGYTFNGYYDATSGGTKYYNANGSSAKAWDKTATATLYAQWTALKYELGYDNLFHYYDWQRSSSAALRSTASGEVLTLGDGTIKITSSSAQHIMTKYGASADFYNIPVQPNTTYRFSCTLEGISQRSQVYWVPITSAYAYVDASPYYRSLTASGAEGDKTATFTTPADCAYVQLFFDVHDVNVYMTFENIKLTKEAPFGSVTATAVRKSYTYNDNGTTKYGTLATVTRTGYTFAGWYTAESGGNQVTANSSVLPQCSTVWSQWTANTYYVAFNANGGSGTMSNETFTYDTAKALTANAFTRTGYTFAGWATSASGAKVYNDKQSVSNLTATSGATVTLYATWTANTYTVTLDRQGGTGGSTSVSATYDSAMPTATMPTRSGFAFAGYYDATSGGTQYYKAEGTSARSWNKTADTTLWAKWTGNTYYVAFNANGGTGTMSNETFTYGADKALTANAFARTGYTFAGWNTKSDGTGTSYSNSQSVSNLTAENNGTVTLYAKWTAKTYTITFNANGGEGGTCQELEYGATIVVPTVTREGYTFSGWQPAVPATVSGNATYEAQWTVNKYTITFDANGGKGGSSIEMDYGADIVAPTVTREGYTFSGWQPAADTVPASNATYVAQWIADLSFTITFEVDGGAFTDPATNSVNTVYTNGCAYGWLPIATKKNHEFAGWWTSQEPTNRVQQLATNIATNTISKLYARWKESLPMVTVSEDSNSTNVVWGTEFGDLKMIPSTVPDGKYFAWWCDTDGKPIADDYVVTNDITVTPQWSVVDILQGEVAFEKDEWTYANGGFRSKSMPKESNESRSLIAKLRYAGTISFDYAALLTRIDDSRAKLVLKSDDGNTTINFPSGEIYGRTNAVANGVFEWTISGRWANSINDYAAISNIQYNIATSEWVDAWCSTNSSTRTLKLVTPAEAGVLSFNWRVNGETGYVDTNGVYRLCDRLSFRELGGTPLRVEGFSEENRFTHVCVTNETASSHVFVWRYEKDYDCDAGDDAAWIKDIVWTPLAPSAEDTVIEYTSLDGTEITVSIPNSWIDDRNLRTGEMSYSNAVSGISATSGLPYWVGYIIGEDPDAELRITNFVAHAGAIAIGWAPNRPDRVYTIWGKTNLTDAAWHTPTNSATRFFTVEVSMPK